MFLVPLWLYYFPQVVRALRVYRKAHDAEPQRTKPLVALGQVLMEMQRPDQASEAFSAALVVDGRDLEALRGLGNARLALHKPEEAIPPLKEALTSSANDFRVLNALGVAFDMSGDHGSAHQYYRTGLKPNRAQMDEFTAMAMERMRSLNLPEVLKRFRKDADGGTEVSGAPQVTVIDSERQPEEKKRWRIGPG